MIKTLLIIAHAPSINTQALADNVYQHAVEQGRCADGGIQFQIIQQSPQATTAENVLNADAVILGTTENLGYMAGLTKDFFDRCYYDLLDQKQGMPYAVYIRAGHDGTGTERALTTINNGLRWQMIQPALILRGEWCDEFLEQVAELAITMVVGMEMGIL